MMISPTNFFGDEGIDFASAKRITRPAHVINSRKTDIKPGDLLIHRIGAGLGRVRSVDEEMPEFSILHSLALIRPNLRLVNLQFLKWSLRNWTALEQMGLGTQSIGVPDLGLDKIASIVISVPPLREQESIASNLITYATRVAAEEQELDKLRQLKQGLMNDLLTGRVRVPMPEERVEDDNVRAAVRTTPVAPALPVMPDMPPPVPAAVQSPAMFRASPGANPAAQGAWVEQVRAAVTGQQVGTYSPEALDALLPELAITDCP